MTIEGSIFFTKMQALGNDFVVIDTQKYSHEIPVVVLNKIANRKLGVGCDQILILGCAKEKDTDFYLKIFNADGSESFQCGNGMRCIARYIFENALSKERNFRIKTGSNIYEAVVYRVDWISINMQQPILELRNIPFSAEQINSEHIYYLKDIPKDFAITPVSMGNPHAVIFLDMLKEFDIKQWGERISHHPQFPERTNVEFVEILSPEKIRIRIYERGVGVTDACGSGACAAVVAAQLLGKCQKEVRVIMPGGELEISWQGLGSELWMTGSAQHVFDGKFALG